MPTMMSGGGVLPIGVANKHKHFFPCEAMGLIRGLPNVKVWQTLKRPLPPLRTRFLRSCICVLVRNQGCRVDILLFSESVFLTVG